MHRGEDGVWRLRFDPGPGVHLFRYLVDDRRWRLDPAAHGTCRSADGRCKSRVWRPPLRLDPDALADSVNRMMERAPENMYLTHFGRVQDVSRLAADMHEGIRFFADRGEKHAQSDQRTRRIEDAMMDWLTERVRRHGVTLEDAALEAILRPDVVLNTQGIEFWLDHRR